MAVGIVLLGIVQQAVGHLNGDVSWFITFAERVWNGARPYVDVGDPNLPAAFLVYMPAVIAEHYTGLHAEAFAVAEVLMLAAASLLLTARIVRPAFAENPFAAGLLRNAALWVLLVVPGFGFAEREHVAVIAMLPILAVLAMRAEGRSVGLRFALVAGAAGGAALALKPHYALPLGFAGLTAAWRGRSLAVLVKPEIAAVAAAVVVNATAIWFFYPDYVSQMLPLALDVYAPARQTLSAVLASPLVLANVGLLAVTFVVATRARADARVVVLLAASAGFLLTFVVQAKIWFNHAYPGLALAELAALVLALDRHAASATVARFGRLCAVPALLCAPFFSAVTMNLPGAAEHPGLLEAVRAVAPAKPKIAALAEQLDFGFPLTRQVGGTWIGRQNALWITNCVNHILATTHPAGERRAKLAAYALRDREDFAADIETGRPDVLIVESAALRQWAQSQTELAGLLDVYRHAANAGEVEVWVRSR